MDINVIMGGCNMLESLVFHCRTKAPVILAIFFVICSQSAFAGIGIESEAHAQVCGCGMKCKRDRCCCERRSNDLKKSNPDDSPDADENNAANQLCQWSSPCGESPASPQSPQNRPFSSKPDIISSFKFIITLLTSELVELTDVHCMNINFGGIERPPRL